MRSGGTWRVAKRGMAAAMACATLALLGGPQPAHAAPVWRVTARLEVGSGCARGPGVSPSSAGIPVTSTVTLIGPAGWWDLTDVRRHASERAFRSGLNGVIFDTGFSQPPLVSRRAERYNFQLGRRARVAEVAAGGRATVVIRAVATIPQLVQGHIWPWAIDPRPDGLRFRTSLKADRAASYGVVLDVCHARVRSEYPLPGVEHGNHRAWSIAGVDGRRALSIKIAVPSVLHARLSASRAVQLARIIGSELLIALILVLLLRWGRPSAADLASAADDPAAQARVDAVQRARSVAVVLLALLAVYVAIWVVVYFRPHGHPPAHWTNVLQSVGAALALCALYLIARRARGLRVLDWLLVAVCMVAAAGVAAYKPHHVARHLGDPSLVFAGSLVLLVMLTYLAIAGLAELVVQGLAPEPSRNWIKAIPFAAGGVMSAATAVQLVWMEHRWAAGWFAPLYVWNLPVSPRAVWGGLRADIPFFPFGLFSDASGLLRIVAGALIVTVLRARRDGHPRRALFRDDTPSLKLVVLLFAGLVVGGTGLLGFAIPVAFAVAVPLVLLTRSRSAEEAESYAIENGATGAADGVALSDARQELHARALAIDRARQRERSVEGDYASHKIGESTLHERLESARTLADSMVTGNDVPAGAPNVTRRLPPSGVPRDIVLAVGPAGSWWERGLIALRNSKWLICLPVGFYVYGLLRTGFQPGLSGYVHSNVAVGWVVRETSVWVAAAFTMGCLLPYLRGRNGALKGLWLTLMFALPTGLMYAAAALTDRSTADTAPVVWTFRLFELALFFVVNGILLDYRTLQPAPSSRFLATYGLKDARAALSYALPLVLTLYLAGRQLYVGDATHAIQQFFGGASTVLSTGPGH